MKQSLFGEAWGMLDVAKLAKAGMAKKYNTDEVFFNEGDTGSEMYIILKGRVGVYLNNIDGTNIKACELEAGNFFGEMSLLENLPRSASIQALEETVVIVLNQTNFENVISDQPQLAYRIMKGMSSRIRQLNEDLVTIQQSSKPEVNIDLKQEPSSNTKLDTPVQMLALDTISLSCNEDYYLFDKQASCPVCKKEIAVKMVRSSKLKLSQLDKDLRQRYQEFEPLWYMVWICPHCTYANFNYEFSQISEGHIKYILNNINQRKQKYISSYSKPPKMNEVLQAFYLVLDMLLNQSKLDHNRIAKTWLRLSWLNTDAGLTAEARECTSKALDGFNHVYLHDTSARSAEQDQRLTLLLGELSIKLGQIDQALMFFQKTINRGGNVSINRQAQDRLLDIKHNNIDAELA